MDTNTLSLKVAATLAAPAAQTKIRNLCTDPKRTAVSKVWDLRLRGAGKYGEEPSFVTIHNMAHIVSVTGTCENTGLVNHTNII